MESHSILLKGPVFEEWTNLKHYLGFTDSSNFAAHVLEMYKDLHNITDNDVLPKKSGRTEGECYINGVRIKKESSEGESNSCDSVETFSSTASPDPGNQSRKESRPRKKQLRSSWGLESVVQRLHQAKVDSRDDDGWIQEGETSSLSYQDGSGRLPLLDIVKQEQLSEDEDSRFSSPKIIPDSARSLNSQNLHELGHNPQNIDSAYTLRKLLEKPPVNASAELRLNAAELKERGVVINPAISYKVQRKLPVILPKPDAPKEAKGHEEKHDQPPASFALESLIRMALLAKEEGEGLNRGGRENGGSTQPEKEQSENQGFSLGSFQKSLFQIPQAFRDGSPLALRGNAAGSATDAPSLKSILRGREAERDMKEEVVRVDPQASDNAFGVASAAYALQHLAQMQGPQEAVRESKAEAHPTPKPLHQKRHKHDKQRKRQRSGSRNKYIANSLPTVKYLLEKKREGLPLSKYRLRFARKEIDMRHKAARSSGDHHSPKGKRKGLQESTGKRNSRKRSRVPRKQPVKLLPKPSAAASPPPTAIDISTSASQMMKLIAEQENMPSATSSHSANSPQFKTNASPSPHMKSTTSLSLSNSASEVMKLLASKNLENKIRHSDPVASVPLKPVSPSQTPTAKQVSNTTPRTPPAPPVPPPPPHQHPPKSDNFGKSMIGAADIMKQLASSYSQSSPRRLQYPLSLMFASPPAEDSSSAFSLMKQLITKGSS